MSEREIERRGDQLLEGGISFSLARCGMRKKFRAAERQARIEVWRRGGVDPERQ